VDAEEKDTDRNPQPPKLPELKVELSYLPGSTARDVVVIVDVLRMTTTASVLFERGLEHLTVVASGDRARECAVRSGALLVGERQGVKLPGFDGGNSPLEYLDLNLEGRAAVICTSNGSKAVEACAGAASILLGCIRNAGAVARAALALSDTRVQIVCAGTNGAVSMDDVTAGGAIVGELMRLCPHAMLDDGARMALLVVGGEMDLSSLLRASAHGQVLSRLDFDADIDFAAKLNVSNVVPTLSGTNPLTFRRC
jgi:2-phosphosulfolactate phosphatase